MAIQWAGLGPGLLLRLDRRGEETLGSQLQRELRDAIRSGRLREGERLPSTRSLAAGLGVSRGLVLDCYEQLVAEGYLSAQGGSATRVAAGATAHPSGDSAVAAAAPPPAVDFRPGVPDLASFPLHDWLWAVGRAGREVPTAAMGYGDSRGAAALREVLAAYLRRVRGASGDAGRVVICTGYAQGINLLLRALHGHGLRRIAFEDPGDRDVVDLARRAGSEAVPVPVDERGVDVAALAAGARAVIVTPAHQAPTGVVLAPERRQSLVAWAREADAVIIEDEYDNEFRYDRQPVGSLQGLAPDRVASVGTVSKTLAPALRLGWIVCPAWLVEAVAHEKRIADRGSPGLDQLALAALIESGRYDRHLRHMRAEYAARRAALMDALATHAPGLRLSGLAAGFHAVAHLAKGRQEQAVIAAGRQRSVGLYGMSRYRADGGTDPPQLVLGFGNVSVSAVGRGIASIADLIG